ncbi:hypothetical protein ADUPG1_004099, partial [Aduncisulcus paluster]
PGRSRSDDESESESDHPIPMHRMRFPQLHSPRKQSSPFRAAQKNPHSPSASPYRVRMMKKEDSDRHAIGDEVDSSKERSKSHVTESYHDNVSSSISNEHHPYTQKHIPMKPNTAPGGRRGRKRDDIKVL